VLFVLLHSPGTGELEARTLTRLTDFVRCDILSQLAPDCHHIGHIHPDYDAASYNARRPALSRSEG